MSHILTLNPAAGNFEAGAERLELDKPLHDALLHLGRCGLDLLHHRRLELLQRNITMGNGRAAEFEKSTACCLCQTRRPISSTSTAASTRWEPREG